MITSEVKAHQVVVGDLLLSSETTLDKYARRVVATCHRNTALIVTGPHGSRSGDDERRETMQLDADVWVRRPSTIKHRLVGERVEQLGGWRSRPRSRASCTGAA